MNPTEMQTTAREWIADGESLSQQHKAHQWAIADWLIAGLAIKPASEVYDAAEKLFPQYTRTTFFTWVSVARAYPPLSRIKNLTFSHHMAVMRDETGAAGETPESFRQSYLAKAAEGDWTVRQLRDFMAHDLEVRQAAKESAKDDDEGEQPEETATPAAKRGRPQTAFTLASLKPHRRSQLEKLATARAVPVQVLAQILIEEGLDSAVEEINALDERVSAITAEAAKPVMEARRRKNQEYRQRRVDELIAVNGGDAADYLSAIEEYRKILACESRPERPYAASFFGTFNSEYTYANWRVNEMWDEAQAENRMWVAVHPVVPEEELVAA